MRGKSNPIGKRTINRLYIYIYTYHHPVHQFRRHRNHIHTHKYECSQEIHTTIPTYSICLDKTKQLLLNPDKTTCTHTRPCIIYGPSGPNNKQQSTTHGNAPKGSGSYLRPKSHIQHTHPQHLSSSTQTSYQIAHKSTHRNRMG